MCTPVSQCHVHAVSGCDVPSPCTTAPSASPARELLPCPVPNPTAPTLRNPASHSRHTFHPHPTRFPSSPYSLVILSPLACHHSPAALSIPLSSPHRPSPILATISSMACVLKRFPLTSPRKLPLTCVKRGFLRTAEPHRTSQLSPCSPMMSQCHVSMLCLAVMCHAPAPSHHRLLSRANSCRALFPNPTAHTLRNRTSDPDTLSILSLLASLHSPYSHSLTLSLHFPSLCRHHTGPLQL